MANNKTSRLLKKLKDAAQEAVGRTIETTLKVIPIVILAYGCVMTIEHNGLNDSMRTKTAEEFQSPNNHIKKVKKVEERWSDNVIYSPDLTGYNPLVIRELTFDDGSTTTLRYRTQAWQPFRRWINGDEFNPQEGERYEVTLGGIWRQGRPENELVRRVE